MGVRYKVKKGNLRRSLDDVGDDIQTGIRRAVKDSVEAIRDDERDRAPLGTPVSLRGSGDPGELRDSISGKVAADGMSGSVGVEGDAAEYAAFVEHGTSVMDAQPFAAPAAEAERGKLPGRVTKEIRKALR